jgi:3-hydroxymyristoyl/3-hydroxydecanoyl-(acyl carrier protein) dehydratase
VFHFVDQILELDPGRHALGVKHVTPGDTFVRPTAGGVPVLLSCIIGEALGQLGAWNVMAAKDFSVRPVAGVIGEVVITREAAVGDTVLLDTTIDSVTDDAVFYHAVASVDGTEVLWLENTLGPLLPIEQFNDPEELRERLARIHRPGVPTEAPQVNGDPAVPFDVSFDEILSMESGKEATAVRLVSGREAFLADHFPRKPVLPLSLLLESLLQLGQKLLVEDGGEGFVPTGARKVKMTRFVEPGSSLVAKIRVVERSAENALLKFRCEVDGGRVCVGEAGYSVAVGESS